MIRSHATASVSAWRTSTSAAAVARLAVFRPLLTSVCRTVPPIIDIGSVPSVHAGNPPSRHSNSTISSGRASAAGSAASAAASRARRAATDGAWASARAMSSSSGGAGKAPWASPSSGVARLNAIRQTADSRMRRAVESDRLVATVSSRCGGRGVHAARMSARQTRGAIPLLLTHVECQSINRRSDVSSESRFRTVRVGWY